MENLLHRVDHLVLAVPDLEGGIEYVYELTGARAKIGGQHRGRGTWNALLALGTSSYLEIIAPDPDQAVPEKGRWMMVDQIAQPTLIHWAAKVHPIEKYLNLAKEHHVQLGAVSSGSRTKMNGEVLSWMLTEPRSDLHDCVFPFLIDWEKSEHPAESLPQLCSLLTFSAYHPDPIATKIKLNLLDIDMKVQFDEKPRLEAKIQCPKGEILLGGLEEQR